VLLNWVLYASRTTAFATIMRPLALAAVPLAELAVILAVAAALLGCGVHVLVGERLALWSRLSSTAARMGEPVFIGVHDCPAMGLCASRLTRIHLAVMWQSARRMLLLAIASPLLLPLAWICDSHAATALSCCEVRWSTIVHRAIQAAHVLTGTVNGLHLMLFVLTIAVPADHFRDLLSTFLGSVELSTGVRAPLGVRVRSASACVLQHADVRRCNADPELRHAHSRPHCCCLQLWGSGHCTGGVQPWPCSCLVCQ
jgi:hypothetical protein